MPVAILLVDDAFHATLLYPPSCHSRHGKSGTPFITLIRDTLLGILNELDFP